ncbi:MAG: hypothetical protein LR015_13925 [Verrucomicrobia bacterium]|nr:hypothetical protein [Verrucomicrobiota bacterium]
MKNQLIPATAVLVLGATTLAAQLTIDTLNTTLSQNFSGFNGTEASLPAGWSWQTGGGTDIFRGAFNSGTNNPGDFTGVMAATNGTSANSIVWRESTGTASLDDFRLIFAVTNNTGSPITSFEFTYTLETWVNGRRDNEMRFKYDVSLDPVAAGRSLFETDILARDSEFTRNPNHTPITAMVISLTWMVPCLQTAPW